MSGGDGEVVVAMGIVVGSCMPDEENEGNSRFHQVVYGNYIKFS